MNKVCTLVVVLAVTVGSALSQGVFSANLNGVSEIPPNSSQSVGAGSLTLAGNALSFSVTALLLGGSIPVDAGVFGPATPAQIGPMIFDLGVPTLTPVGGNLFAAYSGVANLTPAQVSQVLADLTYAEVVTQEYPAGEIRGQITLVPEPSSVMLLGVGSVMFFLQRRKKA